MKHALLSVLLLLAGCVGGPETPVEAPADAAAPTPAATAPKALHGSPRASQDLPGAPTKASVLLDWELADQLSVAYVLAPGSTPDGILRARVLTADAARQVAIMKRRGRPADVAKAARAVADLLELVR